MSITLTNHAQVRLKERYGVKSKKKAEHLVANAFARGLKIDEAKGTLKEWLERKQRAGSQISCYQNYAFVFSNANECITVLEIPPSLLKKQHIKRCA